MRKTDDLTDLAIEIEFEASVGLDEGQPLRGALEGLLGLATAEIEAGSFEDNPPLEEQVQDDRNFLQRELARSPDLNVSIAVFVAQRIEEALVPVIPDDAPGETSWRDWLAKQLGWREFVQNAAAAGGRFAGGAGVIEALSVTGPAGVIIGAM